MNAAHPYQISDTPPPDPDSMLTVAECAALARVDKGLIYSAINDKDYPVPLPAVRLGKNGGSIRVRRADFTDWQKSHTEVGAR